MKKNTIFIACLLLGLTIATKAQTFSCGGPARLDVTYANVMGPLELVSISLMQDKAGKVSADTKDRSGGTITAPTYYGIPGAVSTAQFTSVEANIGFGYCTSTPVFELYKTAVKNGLRTFTIPAGMNGNAAVNIPIQVIYPLGWSPDKRGQGYIKIKFINGYLLPGEYVVIDKTSLSSDGTQLKGVAFSIK